MTLNELLNYLDQHTDYDILDGDADQSIQKAREGSHKNPYASEIINAALTQCALKDGSQNLERMQFVKSLGALRLKYMADDAPVEGFRIVEKIITTADAAFNDETLRNRGK